MNLINFHKYPKNKKFVQENIINYSGQGLCNSYWVMLMGNGYNKYILTAEINQTNHRIIVYEQYVVEWKIKANSEDNEEYDCFSFRGLGIIENTDMYIYLHSDGCDDYEHLNGLKIIDVTVENNRPDEPFDYISNENQYCDDLMLPRGELINSAMENKINTENKSVVDYTDLFDPTNWNQMMYIMMDLPSGMILPLEIVGLCQVNSADNNCATMDANVYYQWDKIYVRNIELFYNCEIVDPYNINICMKIGNKEIDGFCYFVKK
jgi:hypothetical protein